MKTTQCIFNLLIFIFLSAAPCFFAQNRDLTFKSDTSRAFFIPNDDVSKLSVPGFFERRLLTAQDSNLPSDSSTIWLSTRMWIDGLSELDPMKANFKSSVLNPLGMQLADMESMKEWKYILSTLQLGTVGYFAYEHIKKYGFFK
jgi:hypothetical protein